ncbi:MAG: MFS transporter [Armatimonadetes bacterium]|nr:MFS transporter [Armatimonadota bacterium]
MPSFRNHWSWYYGLSSYWFATSAKWFILLLVLLPGKIETLVPGGEKGGTWGTVVAIGATWAVIGPALFGFLSDRLMRKLGGRARFLGIAAAVTCIALMLLWRANTVPMIIVGYLLLQVSDDMAQGPYQAMIPTLVPEQYRGKASAAMGLLQNGAQLFIALFALALGGDATMIFISLALLHVICVAIVSITLKDTVVIQEYEEDPAFAGIGGFIKSWREPWKSRDFFWVWFTRFLNALGFYIVLTYLRYFLSDVVIGPHSVGLTVEEVGVKASSLSKYLGLVISATGIFGALAASKFCDSIGRKRTIRMSGLIMLGAILPFIFVPLVPVIYGAATVFGLGYGIYLSADWAVVSDILPNPERAGAEMGVWSMSTAVTQIFAGGVGLLIDAGNRMQAGRGYLIAFSLAGIAFFLSTELIVKVKGSS